MLNKQCVAKNKLGIYVVPPLNKEITIVAQSHSHNTQIHTQHGAVFLCIDMLVSCLWPKLNNFVVLKSRDKLELKAVNDGSVSYAALEKKAELYEKLARGELSDEEEKEKYCVDFFRKNVEQDESEQPRDQDASSATVPPESEDGENDASSWFKTKPLGLGRVAATLDNDEHKRFVR